LDTASEILLRLADPAARSGILTPDALLAVVMVAYDLGPAPVTDPATATFDRFDIAVPLRPQATAMAQIRKTAEPIPWEVAASWDTTLPPSSAADAVWAGSIVVRTATVTDTIVAVTTAQPDLDAAFAAALAALPATATPDQVRAALRTAASTDLASPPLTDTELDALLHAVASDSDDPLVLGRQAGGRDMLAARLQMSPPGQDPAPTPVALPVVVAFVVADAATSPRELLQATSLARQGAASYTAAAVPVGAPARLVDRLVCWVVPGETFDDPGWPGAASGGTAAQQRDARLQAARSWLAGQGIAVITTEEAT